MNFWHLWMEGNFLPPFFGLEETNTIKRNICSALKKASNWITAWKTAVRGCATLTAKLPRNKCQRKIVFTPEKIVLLLTCVKYCTPFIQFWANKGCKVQVIVNHLDCWPNFRPQKGIFSVTNAMKLFLLSRKKSGSANKIRHTGTFLTFFSKLTFSNSSSEKFGRKMRS